MKTRENLRTPLNKGRIRAIDKQGFSFIPHRFLNNGFFQALNKDELCLYLFLILAGNRHGVSFYRYDSICDFTNLSLDDYIHTRNSLIKKDLIAFDGRKYQVLSLPEENEKFSSKCLTAEEDFENRDPATIRSLIMSSLEIR